MAIQPFHLRLEIVYF